MRVATKQYVDDVGASRRLLPKEADVDSALRGTGAKKKQRMVNGVREYQFEYAPNDHGKPTKAGAAMQELLRPHREAEIARTLKHANKERVALKDRDGGVHYLEPALAENAALRNGWSHRPSYGGLAVQRGPDGMLFRLTRQGWEPSGRWCATRPITHKHRPEMGRKDGSMRCSGLQRDPDGFMWRGLGREWVKEDVD